MIEAADRMHESVQQARRLAVSGMRERRGGKDRRRAGQRSDDDARHVVFLPRGAAVIASADARIWRADAKSLYYGRAAQERSRQAEAARDR
jgi:hypothetical protein